MADFVISPLAVSFESIKNNLQTYVLNKPENESWKDFYASAAGETVLEIAAALGAFYAYHMIIGRRESYLPLAENYTSIVGLAENNGYSCNRGTNLQISINIVPNQTITLPKWTIVGSYAEYDIVLTKDVILNKGIATDIDVVIGNLLSESTTVTTNKLTQFSFYNSETTETIRLLLNDTEVPLSTEIKDLLNDKYVGLTNVYGSIDVFYLQAGDYKYNPNDTLSIEFIQRNNVTLNSFASSNLSIDYASQINECTLTADLVDIETKEQIKLKAPLYHETSMVIRSRKDYPKYLLLANDNLIQANDRDINPGLIELTYLKKDYSSMNDEEKQRWLDAIEESRPSGVARATISDPIRITKNLKIRLWKSDNEIISTTVNDEIEAILNNYNNKFETILDLNQIEHDIEKISGVKIARVSLEQIEWEPNTQYNNLDTLSINNNTFYVSDFLHKSGTVEPEWPQQIDETVTDNEIVWVKVKDYESSTVHTWQPNTAYSKFDYIRKDVLTDGTYATSGLAEPAWGTQQVYDNNIVWTLTDEVSDNIWYPRRAYFLGDVIKVTQSDLIDGEPVQTIYYYKCASCYKYEESNIFMVQDFISKSSSSQPDWTSSIVYDGNIIWTKTDVASTDKSWAPSSYFKLGDSIKVNDEYFIATSFLGNSGNSEPDWSSPDNGNVYDGNIIWTITDSVQKTFALPWNNYLQLTSTYEIVG